MRDLENFKQTLGPLAEKYTPAQLEELRRQMYGMADLLLHIYLSSEEHLGDQKVDVDCLRGTMKSERSKNEQSLG